MKLVALLVVAGCGRIEFDARPLDAEGSGDGASGSGCLGTGAFTDIQKVTAIDNSDSQTGSFLTPDGLSLIWDQSDGQHQRLDITTRPDRAAAFPSGGLIPGMFPAASESDGSLTADGLELYFDSDQSGSLCLYRATRTSTTLPFDPPVELAFLCATDLMAGPQISADGLTLVYNSALDAADEGDLYITVRADRTAEFPIGKKLLGLPTGIGYAALSADRLRLWFEEELPPGGFKIVTAERISPSDVFSQLRDLTEIDSGTSEGDVSLTLDESQISFVSKRDGTYDVFVASRPCL